MNQVSRGMRFYLGRKLYHILDVPWRVGTQVGRTIYIDPPNEGKHPAFLIGMMDSIEIAQHVVECHNAALQNRNHGPSVPPPGEAVPEL